MRKYFLNLFLSTMCLILSKQYNNTDNRKCKTKYSNFKGPGIFSFLLLLLLLLFVCFFFAVCFSFLVRIPASCEVIKQVYVKVIRGVPNWSRKLKFGLHGFQHFAQVFRRGYILSNCGYERYSCGYRLSFREKSLLGDGNDNVARYKNRICEMKPVFGLFCVPVIVFQTEARGA